MTCIIQTDRFYIMYVAQISNVEIIDLNSISIALASNAVKQHYRS